MALKQRLQQKQLQRLSPQQIQLMKLLQVPTIALEQRIKEELEGNPALEALKHKLATVFVCKSDGIFAPQLGQFRPCFIRQ